jgi:hypothetical protein
VSVLAMVPPANCPITIRGTAPGVPAQTATQMVTVTQPQPGNVSLQFCNPTMFPVWVGYQNGAEQWTQAAGINGAYEFLISSDKGAIGIVTPYGTGAGVGYDVTVVFGTRAKLIEAGRLTCGRTSPTRSLTGTVIGGATDDAISVPIGTAGSVSLFQNLGAGYTLSQVEVGVRDLFTAQHRPYGAPGSSKVIIRRGVDFAPGSPIPVLDFASAEAQVADRRTLTVENTGGQDWWLQVRLRTTVHPEYANAFFGRYLQPTRVGAVFATTGCTGGPSVELTTPDLRGVPGWQSIWGPIPGTTTELYLWGFGWSGTSNPLFPGWHGQVVTEPGVTLQSAVLYTATAPSSGQPDRVTRSRAVTRPAPP